MLYGVWGLLLRRYNDCNDVVFGVTVSGRTAPIKNMEDMVGLFINTIPLRIQTPGNEKTVDFLNRLNREIQYRENDAALDEKIHYDLTVGISLFNGIEVDFGFKEALFDRSSIERLATHYMNIIMDIVANPAKELASLEILSEEEKNTLLYSFNDTRADYPQDKTIHQLFSEQASKTPDCIAIFGHGRTRTNTDFFT